LANGKRRLRAMVKLIGGVLALLLAYFLLWPVPVEPQSWQAPQKPPLEGAYSENTALQNIAFLPLGNAYGPEDIAIDADGFLYTGVEDGRILKINPDSGAIETIAQLEGRPLGLEFSSNGDLLIADAYTGLVRLDVKTGMAETLATQAADGSDILYADDLDSTNGIIYLSDASTKFDPKQEGTLAASLLEIWEQGRTGRVLTYTPEKGAETFATRFSFANGVAMAENSVLVIETGRYRIWRYYTDGPKAREKEIWADNLPGFPDNINADAAGGYFVGLPSPRSPAIDGLSDKPLLRKILYRIPGFQKLARPKPYSFLLRLGPDGKVLQSWQDPQGGFHDVTGAVRGADGRIFVSSLTENRIAIIAGP
jgi:sugar lactone lactonase YvrE